tara:strand:- start:274 stop:765 length:492 start_codon:yes stop_codon:yes gene_type:complete
MKSIKTVILALLLSSSLVFAGRDVHTLSINTATPEERACMTEFLDVSYKKALSAAGQEALTAHEYEKASGVLVTTLDVIGKLGVGAMIATNPALAASQNALTSQAVNELNLGKIAVGSFERFNHAVQALYAHLKDFEIYRLKTHSGESIDILFLTEDQSQLKK